MSEVVKAIVVKGKNEKNENESWSGYIDAAAYV